MTSMLFALLWIGAAFATGASLYGPAGWSLVALECGLCAFAATVIVVIESPSQDFDDDDE